MCWNCVIVNFFQKLCLEYPDQKCWSFLGNQNLVSLVAKYLFWECTDIFIRNNTKHISCVYRTVDAAILLIMISSKNSNQSTSEGKNWPIVNVQTELDLHWQKENLEQLLHSFVLHYLDKVGQFFSISFQKMIEAS